jgi:triosephosphate isomerase
MSFIIAATFKSHKLSAEVEEWLEEVSPVASKSSDEIVVAPSFVHLPAAHSKISLLKSNILLSAQDVSPFPLGSYTGAVNAEQLKDVGVKYCIIGHSERRRYFHETNVEIANKASELIRVGIIPILCLAEPDIFPQLAALENELKNKIVYCFEPPSNIGGTNVDDLAEIKRVVGVIRKSLEEPVRVMYGGSVNSGNIQELCNSVTLEGVLVATASLDPKSFISIIKEHAV